MKKALLLLLFALPASGMELSRSCTISKQESSEKLSQSIIAGVWKEQIKQPNVIIPLRFGEIKLYHSDKGFRVYDEDNKKHKIQNCFVDPVLRNIKREDLASLLTTGYLVMNRTHDGDYSLKANVRTVGGGVIGAAIGAFIGKAVVHVVGHGTILIISACTGPAAKVTFLALEGCFAPAIEVASIKGAIAGGMIGATVTGPV